MTRRNIPLLIVGTVLFISLCCVLPLVSLAQGPTPSPSQLENYFRGANSNDGRTYEFTWVRRPSWQLIDEPKGWVWLRIEDEAGKLVDQGLYHVALVDSRWPVFGEYISARLLMDHWLEGEFANTEIAYIRQLQMR